MPAKKSTKKVITRKTAVKADPVMEHKCTCGEHCHCHGRAHWLKHVIILAIVFALGMVVGKILPCGHEHKPMPQTHPVFVNGCLDVSSVVSPKLKEKLATADVDADKCISIEEYRRVRKEMRSANNGPRGPKAPRTPKAAK